MADSRGAIMGLYCNCGASCHTSLEAYDHLCGHGADCGSAFVAAQIVALGLWLHVDVDKLHDVLLLGVAAQPPLPLEAA